MALPSLISNDLVIVYPMKSRTGFIQYIRFVAGSEKGGVKQGDLFSDPFKMGKMTEDRVRYTGATVVETVKEAGKVAWMQNGRIGCMQDGKFVEGKVEKLNDGAASTFVDVADLQIGDKVSYIYDNVVIPQNDIPQLVAEVDGIELAAKARRIGIYYSQMAAFQAKTEMGIDLGEVLATQACAELSYRKFVA